MCVCVFSVFPSYQFALLLTVFVSPSSLFSVFMFCPSPQVQTRSVANIVAQLTCSSCHPVYVDEYLYNIHCSEIFTLIYEKLHTEN